MTQTNDLMSELTKLFFSIHLYEVKVITRLLLQQQSLFRSQKAATYYVFKLIHQIYHCRYLLLYEDYLAVTTMMQEVMTSFQQMKDAKLLRHNYLTAFMFLVTAKSQADEIDAPIDEIFQLLQQAQEYYLTPENHCTAGAYYALSLCYYKNKEYSSALASLRAALDIYAILYGEFQNSAKADCLCLIAKIEFDQRNFGTH